MRVTSVLCFLLVTLTCASAKASIFDRLIPGFNENTADGEIVLTVPLPLENDTPASQETRGFVEQAGDKPEDADAGYDSEANEHLDEVYDDNSNFWNDYFNRNSTKANSTGETDSGLKTSPVADNTNASSLDNEPIEGYSGSEMLVDDSAEEDLAEASTPEPIKDEEDLGPELTGEEEEMMEVVPGEVINEKPVQLDDDAEPTPETWDSETEAIDPKVTDEEDVDAKPDLIETDKAIHVDGDVHPSPLLEETERDVDDREGDNEYEDEGDLNSESDSEADLGPELTGEEEGTIEIESDELTNEKPVQLDEDAEPSPETRDSETYFGDARDEEFDPQVTYEEDVDAKPDLIETDKSIHVDGDVHPSSLVEETKRVADAQEDGNEDEDDLNSEIDVDEEDGPAEKASGEPESDDSLDDGLITSRDEDEDSDKWESKEDAEQVNNEDFTNGEEDESVDPQEEDPAIEPYSEDEDKTEEKQDTFEEDGDFVEENTGVDLPDQELLVEGGVSLPATESEVNCDFEQVPFDLTVKPTSVVAENGKDGLLNCTLIPTNSSSQMPRVTMIWTFRKTNCRSSGTDEICTTQLAALHFEPQISRTSYQLVHKLTALNQTLHGGKYTCTAIIDGCQSQNGTTFKELNLRVYIKPNYLLHIGIISGTCVVLLAILAGLVAYGKKLQARSKNRYQELLSTVDIQYQPTKVLELPNSVYNPTTVKFSRMTPTSSKSSFSSVEDV